MRLTNKIVQRRRETQQHLHKVRNRKHLTRLIGGPLNGGWVKFNRNEMVLNLVTATSILIYGRNNLGVDELQFLGESETKRATMKTAMYENRMHHLEVHRNN